MCAMMRRSKSSAHHRPHGVSKTIHVFNKQQQLRGMQKSLVGS